MKRKFSSLVLGVSLALSLALSIVPGTTALADPPSGPGLTCGSNETLPNNPGYMDTVKYIGCKILKEVNTQGFDSSTNMYTAFKGFVDAMYVPQPDESLVVDKLIGVLTEAVKDRATFQKVAGGAKNVIAGLYAEVIDVDASKTYYAVKSLADLFFPDNAAGNGPDTTKGVYKYITGETAVAILPLVSMYLPDNISTVDAFNAAVQELKGSINELGDVEAAAFTTTINNVLHAAKTNIFAGGVSSTRPQVLLQSLKPILLGEGTDSGILEKIKNFPDVSFNLNKGDLSIIIPALRDYVRPMGGNLRQIFTLVETEFTSQLAGGDADSIFKSLHDMAKAFKDNPGFAFKSPTISNTAIYCTVGVASCNLNTGVSDTVLLKVTGDNMPGLYSGDSGIFGGSFTPTKAGTYQVPVTAIGVGGDATGSLTVIVSPNTTSPNKPIIVDGSIKSGKVGTPYSQNLWAWGDGREIVWTVYTANGGATLPAGLSLSSSGLISGTPSVDNYDTVWFRACYQDTNLCSNESFFVDIAPIGSRPVIEPNESALPEATRGTLYTQTFTSDIPADWSITENPAWLTLAPESDHKTVKLSGTPPIDGGNSDVWFTLSAKGRGAGDGTTEVRYWIKVNGFPPRITADDLDGDVIVGRVYSAQFNATGNDPVTWSLNFGQWAGFCNSNNTTVDASGKVTIGTNRSTDYAGSFTIIATNKFGSSNKEIYLHQYTEEAAKPKFVPTAVIPNGTVGVNYQYSIGMAFRGAYPITIATSSLPPRPVSW